MKASVEKQSYVVQGEAFGARGCSGCTCDPCDCNPCNCGDGVAIPRWRVSGFFVEKSEPEALDVSGLLILSLAQPRGESETGEWQEVLLIDSRASISQADILLNAFGARLASIPAEIGTSFSGQRSVYQVPMSYRQEEQRPWLEVEFTPEKALPIRENLESPFKEWRYSGPMALR